MRASNVGVIIANMTMSSGSTDRGYLQVDAIAGFRVLTSTE